MTAEKQEPELALPPITDALRREIAVRARNGALTYPVVAAILIGMSSIWGLHRVAGIAFVLLFCVIAAARRWVTDRLRVTADERTHRALIAIVACQGFAWGSFVAAIFVWYGLVTLTWLALVVSAGYAGGGTSSMGIDARLHQSFLASMVLPLVVSVLIARPETGIPLTILGMLYYWFLILDARQHARAFDALLRTQHALRIARDQARAADQAKSAFLAMMSHEIRTPMHAVVGTASMLLETPLDDQQRRYTETIMRAGETLVELINDVLDISRMDAQGTQLDAADFHLKTALLEVVQMFEPLARRAQLQFEHELAGSTAIYVSGDRRRLQQIVVNLIGNAIKFTEQGGVVLRANARGAGASFEIALVVADTGIGMEPVQLARLFQPFEQGDTGIARKYGGSGLGLAICKRLAEAMGGRIDVTSARGQGTTFSISLTLPAASDERESASVEGRLRTVAVDGAMLAGIRVLVVDDSALNRELAQAMLERLGCEVETVSRGADAIVACQRSEFAIVLMDCQMRDMDGYATTRQLRALETATARAPILAVTANAFDDDRKRALESGMNDLLAKPFGIRDLQRVLQRWLPAAAQTQQSLPAARPFALNASLYPRAMQHISAMLDGALDVTVMDRVVDAFLQQWPQRLAGLEAALRDNDTSALREIIHTLDGAVPYFGIERLNSTLRRLQQYARAGELSRAQTELSDFVLVVDELAASRARHRAAGAQANGKAPPV